jgi:predicted Zn-dependent peptidase
LQTCRHKESIVPQEVHQHTYANGLTLLAERMEHVRSAALSILVPAGCVYDPPEHPGLASVLSDLLTRGAGDRDSRALTLALDNLGADRGERASQMHLRLGAHTLARNLPAVLDLYADILCRPHLPEDELEPVQELALQALQGIEDEPQHKMFIELRRRHYPPPLGRDPLGTEEGIESLTTDAVRGFYRRLFGPRGTIVSVAGNVEWEPLRDQVGRLFGDWKGAAEPALTLGETPGPVGHVAKETAQTQIGLAYPSVPISHPDYYAARGAVNVLSGGMSSRLFTEVREKRGLCYSVGATYQTFKDRASILCYAGTTNDRAQETLDVVLAELRRLGDGVDQEEVDRVRAGLKSALIMQEESTGSRAATLASDWYFLGRVRSFDEMQATINALTPEAIVDYARRFPPRDLTIVTLGPKPLRI